jgi:hypothetical protein
VRTLGGTVGEIGQIVQGEAVLEHGVPAVFFLRDSVPGTYSVTGMAQGHYGLHADQAGAFRLLPSSHLPEFVNIDEEAAVARLRDKTVADCERLVGEQLRAR